MTVHRIRLTAAVVLGLGMHVAPAVLVAVEEAEPSTPSEPPAVVEPLDLPEAEELEAGYAYGTVVEVGADRLVVSEYDELTGMAANVTYAVDPEVTFYEVPSLAEVAVGDEVDIDYVMKDGERHAVAIAVEKITQEGGEVEEDRLR